MVDRLTLLQEADRCKYLLAVRPVGEILVLHFDWNLKSCASLHHVESSLGAPIPESDAEIRTKERHLFVAPEASELAYRFFRGAGARNKAAQLTINVPLSAMRFNEKAKLLRFAIGNPIDTSRSSMNDRACNWQIKETIRNALAISPAP